MMIATGAIDQRKWASKFPPPVGDISIGDYLIERLHFYGVEHAFGIPGDYVITLYEQMRTSGLITPVNTVDEQGSGFAADSYARLRGLSACVQTYGVGGLKSLHTTAEAFAERSPVVVISGAPGMNERAKGELLHHLIDGYYTQLKMFEEVTVASTILEEPMNAFSEIDRLLSAALRFKRPVYIEIPRDQFVLKGDPSHIPSDYRRPGSNKQALQEALAETVERINQAENPVIWAGAEIQRCGLKDTLSDLVEATNIPFATTILGKAVISELHPQFMGVYQGVLSPSDLREYVEASDCLVALGVLMTDINLGLFTAQIDPQTLIHVNLDGMTVSGHCYEQVRLEDIVESLVMADIDVRDAEEIPRPLMTPVGTSDDIYLQSNTGTVIPISDGESIAGRSPNNEIVIDAPTISKQHMSFTRENNQIWATDLDSRNGTFINDSLLTPNKPQALARGDEVGLGRRLSFIVLGHVEKSVEKLPLMEIEDSDSTMISPIITKDDIAALSDSPSDDMPRFFAVPGQKITSGRMFEAVNAFIDDNTIVTADNGETLIAGVDLIIHKAEGFFGPGYYTSVGFAIPIAMGAQLARPDWRPLCLVGDAAFQMTGVELSTMARFGLNPIVIVMSNGGYGSERPIFDAPYVDVQRWNYATFTDVLGTGRGFVVKTEDEFEQALTEARDFSEDLVIIDVHLEKFDYSPPFKRFLKFFAKSV